MQRGLGCLRELPDPRDWYIDSHPAAQQLFHTRPVFGQTLRAWVTSASSVDLRRWCSPVEDQGALGSCTAQTAAGMVEFLERRALNRHTDASRLFIYKTTRNLLGWTGDTGAYIRSTMKALTIFGAPPEDAWPYETSRYEEEPTAYCYAYGQSFQALRYFRLDRAQQDRESRINLMRSVLQAQVPIGLGFLVYNYGNEAGEFTLPEQGERPLGGHAVMLCGYDEHRAIGGSKGAFLLRNSWSKGWGDGGYGWLPYDYVRRDLAWDIWALFKAEYLTEQF
jgi:C1A family cysteine protease